MFHIRTPWHEDKTSVSVFFNIGFDAFSVIKEFINCGLEDCVLGIPLTSYETAWRTTITAVPERLLHYMKFEKICKIKKTQSVCVHWI